MINDFHTAISTLFVHLQISSYDFNFVDIDYDSYEDCDGECEGESGICRCSRIDNASVLAIDEDKFFKQFVETFISAKKSVYQRPLAEIDTGTRWLQDNKQQFFKLFTDMGLFNTANYTVEVDNDPYGDTLGKTVFNLEDNMNALHYHILKLSLCHEPKDMAQELDNIKQEFSPPISPLLKKVIKIKKI